MNQRKAIIAGNWKMNGGCQSIEYLLGELIKGFQPVDHNQMVVFPSSLYLSMAQNILTDSQIAWGGQAVSEHAKGAYTGDIAAGMLTDVGCHYTLVGHSERRQYHAETCRSVAKQFQLAQQHGICPLLCIGETQAQREEGKTEAILTEQLMAVVELAGIGAFANAVIAYEPVWAIGTGVTATPAQAQTAHAFIRGLLSRHDRAIADQQRILYGGSVKSDNAAELFAMEDVDGGLVGGASLQAEEFLTIYAAYP